VGNNDLERDPDEMVNLAVETAANHDLILGHNELLNRLIAREAGDKRRQLSVRGVAQALTARRARRNPGWLWCERCERKAMLTF
jgi:hypothetical protein